jgi:hypothetical protein
MSNFQSFETVLCTDSNEKKEGTLTLSTSYNRTIIMKK